MFTDPEDPRDDAIFSMPPPGPEPLRMLEAKLRNFLASGEDASAAIIDDFRMFILARSYQGRTQAEVEDELIGWGLDSDYAIELVSSTRQSRNFGGEVVEQLRVGGRIVGSWTNAYAPEKRLAKRVARQHAKARQLAGLEPEDAPVDLGFDPQALLASTKRPFPWRKLMFVILGVAAVGLACGGVFMLVARIHHSLVP